MKIDANCNISLMNGIFIPPTHLLEHDSLHTSRNVWAQRTAGPLQLEEAEQKQIQSSCMQKHIRPKWIMNQ